MKRRAVLASGVALASGFAGCLNRIRGGSLSTEFERIETDVEAGKPPEVTLSEKTVTATGTVQYGSSTCGTVELAHAEYEGSQDRVDLLIVAADDSGLGKNCTDDLPETGYRVEATIDDTLRRATVTEHHVFGEAYSTVVRNDE